MFYMLYPPNICYMLWHITLSIHLMTSLHHYVGHSLCPSSGMDPVFPDFYIFLLLVLFPYIDMAPPSVSF